MAAAFLDAPWQSKWICGVPLDEGRQKANIQIARRAEGQGSRVLVAVHVGPEGAKKLAGTLAWAAPDFHDSSPEPGIAYLGKRREPLLLVHSRGTTIVTFQGVKPVEDQVLSNKLLKGHGFLFVERGELRKGELAEDAGIRFSASGVGPWIIFSRPVFITSGRDVTYGKWREEPDSGPDFLRISGGMGKDEFRVDLRKENFRVAGHRVSYSEEQDLRVDGIHVRGFEPYSEFLATREQIATVLLNRLKSIEVRFAGRRVLIPKKLIQDCFNVHFEEENRHVWVGRQNDDLFINLLASDGAGGYSVTWRITRKGKVTRDVTYP